MTLTNEYSQLKSALPILTDARGNGGTSSAEPLGQNRGLLCTLIGCTRMHALLESERKVRQVGNQSNASVQIGYKPTSKSSAAEPHTHWLTKISTCAAFAVALHDVPLRSNTQTRSRLNNNSARSGISDGCRHAGVLTISNSATK